MAVDESLLFSYVGPDPPGAPTLRLYAWDPPALSLGKAQPAARSHDPGYLRERGIDLVRRPTGGRAVLHDRECTYAVIGRLGSRPFPGGVLETYREVAAALARALELLGLSGLGRAEARAVGRSDPGPACFAAASAHEITWRGRKLVGSAQLRRRGAFLQHGSIPLRADGAGLARALGGGTVDPVSADLAEALGRAPAWNEVADAMVEGFARSFGVELRRSELTADESVRAERLRCWKYDSAAWTLEGRRGERERRWGPDADPVPPARPLSSAR